MSKVIITGVSGSLGSHLAQHFVANHFEVIGISRTNPRIDGVHHVALDLASTKPMPSYGDAPVIHAAAITKDGRDPGLLKANLAMTRAALSLSTGPFIQVSSSSVYDLRKPSQYSNVHEATGNYPFLNSYSQSKFESETLVIQLAAERAIILRPHALIGPTDNTLLPRVKAAIRNNTLRLPGAGRTRHEFTSFHNFAHACQLAIAALENSPPPKQRIFNVTNGTSTAIADAIRERMGAQAPGIVAVPTKLAWMIATLAEVFGAKAENGEPRLSRYQIAQLAFDRSYDLSETESILGYRPGSHPGESNS